MHERRNMVQASGAGDLLPARRTEFQTFSDRFLFNPPVSGGFSPMAANAGFLRWHGHNFE